MTTDRVFVLLMMVLLMMAGCFEATSTTEAQEEQDSTTGNDDNEPPNDENAEDTSNNQNSQLNINHPPVISSEVVSNPQFYNGIDCTSIGIEFEVRHAMMDWDGIIVSAGWDIDLDGHIDYPVSVNEGYTTLRIQFSEMIERNITTYTDNGFFFTSGQNEIQHNYEQSIVFGAVDDDGEITSSQLYKITKMYAQTASNGDYNFVNGYDYEECSDFQSVTNYQFDINDNSYNTSNNYGDYLIDIVRTNGLIGLDVSRISVLFHKSYNVSDYLNTSWEGCWFLDHNLNECQMLIDGFIVNTNQSNSLFNVGSVLTIQELSRNNVGGWNGDPENWSVAILIDGIVVHEDNLWIF